MRIAILSWGSLIETGVERGLEIDGGWHTGGPVLPLEFSRISQSGERAGCLTLVIDERNGVNVPTHYAISSNTNLNRAIVNMMNVERITLTHSIAYVNLLNDTERLFARRKHPIACNTIKAWARSNGFDAVVWTGLLANFEEISGIPFSIETAIQHLSHLREPTSSRAYEYIHNAPPEVVTPLRRIVDDMEPSTPIGSGGPLSFHFRTLPQHQ